MTDAYCTSEKGEFHPELAFTPRWTDRGGLANVGTAKYVLAMSVWDERRDGNLWLDGHVPPVVDGSTEEGHYRGPCATPDPYALQFEAPNAGVIFSNIKFGDIGTTTTI